MKNLPGIVCVRNSTSLFRLPNNAIIVKSANSDLSTCTLNYKPPAIILSAYLFIAVKCRIWKRMPPFATSTTVSQCWFEMVRKVGKIVESYHNSDILLKSLLAFTNCYRHSSGSFHYNLEHIQTTFHFTLRRFTMSKLQPIDWFSQTLMIWMGSDKTVLQI